MHWKTHNPQIYHLESKEQNRSLSSDSELPEKGLRTPRHHTGHADFNFHYLLITRELGLFYFSSDVVSILNNLKCPKHSQQAELTQKYQMCHGLPAPGCSGNLHFQRSSPWPCWGRFHLHKLSWNGFHGLKCLRSKYEQKDAVFPLPAWKKFKILKKKLAIKSFKPTLANEKYHYKLRLYFAIYLQLLY